MWIFCSFLIDNSNWLCKVFRVWLIISFRRWFLLVSYGVDFGVLQPRILCWLVSNLWPFMMNRMCSCVTCLAISFYRMMMLGRIGHLLVFRSCRSLTMRCWFPLWVNWAHQSCLNSRFAHLKQIVLIYFPFLKLCSCAAVNVCKWLCEIWCFAKIVYQEDSDILSEWNG